MASKSTVNLDAMSVEELSTLITDAQAVLSRKRDEQRAALIEETRQKAEAIGLSLADLFPAVPSGKAAGAAKEDKPATRRPVAIKYRDPENPENTWTGRGKEPRWMQDKVTAGAKREDFLVAA